MGFPEQFAFVLQPGQRLAVEGQFDEASAEVGGFLHDGVDAVGPAEEVVVEFAPDRRVVVHVPQLVDMGDPEQRIACDQPVVQECEGLARVHRDEPERDLGHVDGHRVDVHPVETVLDDLPASGDPYRVVVGVAHDLGDLRRRRSLVPLPCPCLDELVSQIPGGGHEERPGTHGDVGDSQCEDLVGGLAFPPAAVLGLKRAPPVHQRFECRFHDFLGE